MYQIKRWTQKKRKRRGKKVTHCECEKTTMTITYQPVSYWRKDTLILRAGAGADPTDWRRAAVLLKHLRQSR